MMKWIYRVKNVINSKKENKIPDKAQNRLLLSLVVGMICASLLCGGVWGSPHKNVMAWWGSIYPEFCFSQVDRYNADGEKILPEQKPKISFWLAKAFERW